jgi:hypothetical protein
MKKPAAAAARTAVQVDAEVVSIATEEHVMKKPAAAKAPQPLQPLPATEAKENVPNSLKVAKKVPRTPPEGNVESRPLKKVSQQSKQRETVPTASEESQPQVEQSEGTLAAEVVKGPHPDSFCKRPLSPTFAFINEKRDEIASLIGSKKGSLVAKKGSELFNALPSSDREERQQLFDEEMKAYNEWKSTDEGRAALMQQRAELKRKRSTRKNRKQRKFDIGARALAVAQEGKASEPSTPIKRKVRALSTPMKGSRILSDSEKKERAEKRREKILIGLRKEVLGATTPRERALALAREAIAKGTIKPSWLERKTLSAEPEPLLAGKDADAEGAE